MRSRRRPSSPKSPERPLIPDNIPESMQNMRIVDSSPNFQDYFKKFLSRSNPFIPPLGDRCPINDLPNELLAHIFWLGTFSIDDDDDEDDEDDENGNDIMKPFLLEDEQIANLHLSDPDFNEMEKDKEPEETLDLPFQVLVSHVCRHWREVAIEAPVLWTAIKFSTDCSPFTRCETWIERSKNFAIDITIDCTHGDDDDDDDDYDCNDSAMSEDEDDGKAEEGEGEGEKSFYSIPDLELMLSMIIPHAHRWRGLEIMVNQYEYMAIATKRLANLPSAQILEVLQLYHYDNADDYESFQPANLRDPFPILFSGNAPKLSHIALWGVHIAWPINKNKFLTGLKDLELAYHAEDVRPSWKAFEQILRTSPELDTLTLCLSGPSGNPSDWYSQGTINLLKLQNLILAYHEPRYISSLLNLLNMPNVTSLALDFEEDFTSFVRQLATPRPGSNKSLLMGLDHLKISGLPCDHNVVDVMYAQLGNLRSINLRCTFLDKIFFTKLSRPIHLSSNSSTTNSGTTTSTPTALYCPNLDTITISGIGGRMMCHFVEARKNAGVPVKRVFMSERDELDEEDEAWLRRHVETFDLFEPSDEENDEFVDGEDMNID